MKKELLKSFFKFELNIYLNKINNFCKIYLLKVNQYFPSMFFGFVHLVMALNFPSVFDLLRRVTNRSNMATNILKKDSSTIRLTEH